MSFSGPSYLPRDGWIPANETWTYASASTITVPTDGTLKYYVGMRVKFTQTTVKYGVVIAVTSTVLTIAVNTDYVVANAAITLPYFSFAPTPLGYPDWFNWTGTPTGFSAVPTNAVYRFRIEGRSLMAVISQGADGTSNATGFTVPAPVTAANISNIVWTAPCAFAVNAGVILNTAIARILPATATIDLFIDSSFTAWTASLGKRSIVTLVYEI